MSSAPWRCCASAIPRLRYVVIGDGPEREPLRRLAAELGVADRVELTGQLPHARALARARRCALFAMPSVDEAFGVAYVEAMAGGLPAIGARGEPGPEDIAAAGGGIRLVAPGDHAALAAAIGALIDDPDALRALGDRRPRDRAGRVHLGALRARDAARLRGRAAMTRRPVLFVINLVPPDRVGAFAVLHDRVGIELALFGGRSHHATAGVDDPGVPYRGVSQRRVHALAASGRYRAVVAGTAGRTALPAAWLGARRARVPFVLWSALWSELRTPAHLLARPLMAAIYRDADAVVAYGSHVARFARDHGARRVTIAPQAVDNAFWSAPSPPPSGPPPSPSCSSAARRSRRARASWSPRGACPACAPRRRRSCWPATATPRPPRSATASTRRDRSLRRICATSMRAPTLWPYRRSPRGASWSPGGSSPTRP